MSKRPTEIHPTQLRTGDIILKRSVSGKWVLDIKLGASISLGRNGARAWESGPCGDKGGSYITWHPCGTVTVLR